MDEGVAVTGGLPVDPCPNGHVELLDRVIAELGDESAADAWARPELGRLTATALVGELRRAQRQRSAAEARWLAVLAEAERREATLRTVGLPTASWLVDERTHSARRARVELRLSVQLEQQPVVCGALRKGRLSVEQAHTITDGLSRLPDDLDSAQRVAVAEQSVEYAGSFDPYGLARLVNRAVEVVAPEVADDADRRAVERMAAEQQRTRFLTWRHDPEDGSVMLNGKLPAVAGEKLIGLVRALGAEARKQAAVAGVAMSRGQAHADSLVRLAEHFAGCRKPPKLGADRPRILVTIDNEVLRGALGTGTLLNTGERITARQARVLACDAGILPVVMGGGSVRLDVGRERRLFSGQLRTLMIARDRGCAFPGCDRPPAECDAHHVLPWHAGGRSCLSNGVLLCCFHHHLCEPEPTGPPDRQWLIRMDAGGDPQFAAPTVGGAPRRWRQHARYRLAR